VPQITINLTTEQAVRVRDAFTAKYGLLDEDGAPIPATLQQIKQSMIEYLKGEVRGFEHKVARLAAQRTITDVEPT